MDFATLAGKIQRLWDAGVDAQTIAAGLRREGTPPALGAAAWDAGLVSRVMLLGRNLRAAVEAPGRRDEQVWQHDERERKGTPRTGS